MSYWKQFEHGMLSREAIRKLTECVDEAVDQQETFIAIDEIKSSWKITGFIPYMVGWTGSTTEEHYTTDDWF